VYLYVIPWDRIPRCQGYAILHGRWILEIHNIIYHP
jgi:hypothetical protein